MSVSSHNWETYWEGRYRQQHKAVHRLEDEIARLRAALHEIASLNCYAGEVDGHVVVIARKALDGTQSVTSVAPETDDPNFIGSKPDADQ